VAACHLLFVCASAACQQRTDLHCMPYSKPSCSLQLTAAACKCPACAAIDQRVLGKCCTAMHQDNCQTARCVAVLGCSTALLVLFSFQLY
jgi:hypothetical protein